MKEIEYFDLKVEKENGAWGEYKCSFALKKEYKKSFLPQKLYKGNKKRKFNIPISGREYYIFHLGEETGNAVFNWRKKYFDTYYKLLLFESLNLIPTGNAQLFFKNRSEKISCSINTTLDKKGRREKRFCKKCSKKIGLNSKTGLCQACCTSEGVFRIHKHSAITKKKISEAAKKIWKHASA